MINQTHVKICTKNTFNWVLPLARPEFQCPNLSSCAERYIIHALLSEHNVEHTNTRTQVAALVRSSAQKIPNFSIFTFADQKNLRVRSKNIWAKAGLATFYYKLEVCFGWGGSGQGPSPLLCLWHYVHDYFFDTTLLFVMLHHCFL